MGCRRREPEPCSFITGMAVISQFNTFAQMRARSIFCLLIFITCSHLYGQADSVQRPDTTRGLPRPAITRVRVVTSDSAASVKATDSITRFATALRADSLRKDSLQKATAAAVITNDTSTYRRFQVHPALAPDQPAIYRLTDYRAVSSKDELFYLMVGVLFLVAFVKAGFPRYFRNLFVVFFQTNLRQKQTRDQLLQDNFASLLMNVLFFISGGLYITLLVQALGWTQYTFWIIAAASALVLLLVYLGKYLFLRFSGWVFNTREAAGSYIFLVFMVNKVMGIALLPFLLLLAFANSAISRHAITVSVGLVALLFIYRYFVSFAALRNRLRVNVFHFLLYLCTVEILPLLLIYKLLLNYFNGTL